MCGLRRSYFIIDWGGSIFEFVDDLFTVIEDDLLLVKFGPGLLVHLFDTCPVHLDSIFELLDSGFYFLIDGLEFVFDIYLQSFEMGPDLVDFESEVLRVFVWLFENLGEVADLNVECGLHFCYGWTDRNASYIITELELI